MVTFGQVEAGQAIYSLAVLRTYDWIVLGLSDRFFWRCPTSELRRLYDRNVSDRHLDVGVGTGYFLDKAKWPIAKPSITLLGSNPNCLQFASKRIRRFAPQTVRGNSLAPTVRWPLLPPPLHSGGRSGKRPSHSIISLPCWHQEPTCLVRPSCRETCRARGLPRRSWTFTTARACSRTPKIPSRSSTPRFGNGFAA